MRLLTTGAKVGFDTFAWLLKRLSVFAGQLRPATKKPGDTLRRVSGPGLIIFATV